MKGRSLPVFLFLILLVGAGFAGTTGKISGVVVDADTGEPLPAVNVSLEGTNLGAATDLKGYYVILNLPPGIYNLKTSMMGYKTQRIANVRVNIDLTREVNFRLATETLAGEEVTIVAERPVVQKDISATQMNLNSDEIKALPFVNVATTMSLEAGVRSGLEIRGGGISQTGFMVNGFTMRDERDNTPYTSVSLTSIEEIVLQTGGFNAEFGNIRSGLVNVVTKDGRMDLYTFGFIGRYRAPAPKHFGHSLNSPESYWIRPYVDDAVCWTGTKNGVWDTHTQLQYIEFEGWNSISEKTLKDNIPENDLTPAAAQRVFLWEHRRQLDIARPDYDLDLSFGGPVPILSKQLGNLRFFGSYRSTQEMYLVPLSDDAYRDYSAQMKLTADIKFGMKLLVEGLWGQQSGTNDNNSGLPGIFREDWEIASALSNGPKYIDGRQYGTDYWCPSTIDRSSIGIKLTHVLNPKTFYELMVHRFASDYSTNPGRLRNTAKIYKFGDNYYIDEAPLGYQPAPSTGIVGLRMGVGMSNSRDSSKVAVYTTKFDMVSQLNQYNNVKLGLELNYTDNNVNYGSVDVFLPSGRSKSVWHTFPVRAALYLQDKLEFKGMIANVGVRVDYSHAGGEWYIYDSFDRALSAEKSLGLDTLLTKEPTKRIIDVSPRVGVAFPITANSKLFFNYGHFRQMPTPENLYLVRRFTDNNAVTQIANPNNPLPKTVAYELGFEQNLFDQFLLRLNGYYKDASNQSRLVTYVSRDNKVNYSVSKPYSYKDTRGFEISLKKNRGDWIRGFINYTYDVSTWGNFGFKTYYENPADQRRYERETRTHYQERPIPQPFARVNLDFLTPRNFGPRVQGFFPLEDWRLNMIASWENGAYDTWTGGGSIPGIVYNVQWKDLYNIDLRLSRNFHVWTANIEFFVDVYNVFNFKFLSDYGFVDVKDHDAYMKSLHLPAAIGDKLSYGNIPGNDRPGDYRTVPYEPYNPNDPDSARKQRILDTKAYIDMPNLEYFTFLNPRNVLWGMKISFDIKN
ncbi:TonB-dependent receptor [candidate division KSB1 bacterium]|nr:TonB-dependent receptor [candidate division KSB1 bacterium]